MAIFPKEKVINNYIWLPELMTKFFQSAKTKTIWAKHIQLIESRNYLATEFSRQNWFLRCNKDCKLMRTTTRSSDLIPY